jgi:hypothetical protein
MEGVAHHSSYRSVLPTEYMIDAAPVSSINVRWKSAVYRGLRKGLPVGRESTRLRSALHRAIFLMLPADLNQTNEADFLSRARRGGEVEVGRFRLAPGDAL